MWNNRRERLEPWVIPTMIVLGLVIGLAPRPWFYLLSLLAGAGWAGVLAINGTVDTTNSFEMMNAFIFGAVNAMLGATLTRVVVPLVRNAIRGR